MCVAVAVCAAVRSVVCCGRSGRARDARDHRVRGNNSKIARLWKHIKTSRAKRDKTCAHCRPFTHYRCLRCRPLRPPHEMAFALFAGELDHHSCSSHKYHNATQSYDNRACRKHAHIGRLMFLFCLYDAGDSIASYLSSSWHSEAGGRAVTYKTHYCQICVHTKTQCRQNIMTT